jgi:hypothetical protein
MQLNFNIHLFYCLDSIWVVWNNIREETTEKKKQEEKKEGNDKGEYSF